MKGGALSENLIWIDMEMTGLDHEKGVILEIATVVTDSALEELAEGPNLAIHHSEETLKNMEEWSREHHQASGLLERVNTSKVDNETAETMTLDFVSKYCKERKSPLCGHTIWQDRRFLIKHMPRLEAFLHYRIIDVSSIKELVQRWYPSLPPYRKKECHLALSDIRESIEELKYYRKKVFIPA